MKKIRVWDLPVRLFHWALAVLVTGAIVTAKIGGDAMAWHFYCGYAVLTLLLFRVLWGVLGGRYARFSALTCWPAAFAAHRRGWRSPGHGPSGSLAVLAILAVLLAQAVSGLLANDDIDAEGPLVKFVSQEWSDRISWFHAELNSVVIYGLIGLHLVAIAYYFFRKRENLVTPMLSGDKEWPGHAPEAEDGWGRRSLAAVLLAACAAGVYRLVTM